VIAMLACARIGAIHSVVFGGFAADQLAIRIDHAKPKVPISLLPAPQLSFVLLTANSISGNTSFF
jgi:hypothetical protein